MLLQSLPRTQHKIIKSLGNSGVNVRFSELTIHNSVTMESDIINWTNKEVLDLLHKDKISSQVVDICRTHDLDGQCLLSFVDRDFYEYPFDQLMLGDRKRFILFVKKLQRNNRGAMYELGLCDDQMLANASTNINFLGTNLSHLSYNLHNKIPSEFSCGRNPEYVSNFAPDVRASKLKPEVWKTAIALGNRLLCKCAIFILHYITPYSCSIFVE